MRVLLESEQVGLAGAEDLLDLGRGAVTPPDPHDLRRRSEHEASLEHGNISEPRFAIWIHFLLRLRLASRAVFFASDGTIITDPGPPFEVPIVPPLPEDLAFIP
jgi:hypothetical protein